MPDDITPKVQSHLDSLLQSIDRDRDTLPAAADRAVFDRLFDAVRSALQNMGESSADEAD